MLLRIVTYLKKGAKFMWIRYLNKISKLENDCEIAQDNINCYWEIVIDGRTIIKNAGYDTVKEKYLKIVRH